MLKDERTSYSKHNIVLCSWFPSVTLRGPLLDYETVWTWDYFLLQENVKTKRRKNIEFIIIPIKGKIFSFIIIPRIITLPCQNN